MPKIVLATFGSYGDLNPYLAIGNALSRRGADVVIATSAVYRTAVERHGLTFASLRPEIREDDSEIFRKVLDPWKGAEFLTRRLLMPAVEETYEDLDRACEGADLIVSHVLMYSGRVVAEHRRIPWMMAILQPMAFFSAYEMPVFPPATMLKHLRFLGRAFCTWLMRLLFKRTASWGDPVRELRRKLGLGPGPNPIREGLFSPDGVLAMFPERFASPQPDWPANTIQCGFPFLDEDFTGSPMGGAILEFLAKGEPPVVFTLGSAAVRIAPWLVEAAAVASLEGGFRAVILAGPGAAEIAKRLGSANTMIVASAPYHELFPRSRVIVHSGGIGTTAQALRSGRSQVVIPFAFDQFDNAERVARLDCGVELSTRQAKHPAQIRKAISRASALAEHAWQLKDKFAANGADIAADAILDKNRGQTGRSPFFAEP
jgi:UDP:flavonoid glycosyltransferase YjiC (YdhE family)